VDGTIGGGAVVISRVCLGHDFLVNDLENTFRGREGDDYHPLKALILFFPFFLLRSYTFNKTRISVSIEIFDGKCVV